MTTPPLTFRPFTDDELPTAFGLLQEAFGSTPKEADLADERAVQDPDRSWAAFDGAQMVGCLGSYPLALTVPGGTVPCAGTTWVTVLPTHRRRGVLSTMMDHHLHHALDQGEPIAALWASESSIYGRYGYGQSTEQLSVEVAVDGALAWRPQAPSLESVRIVDLDAAIPHLSPIHEAAMGRRAGMHARTPDWWRFQVLSRRESAKGGASHKRVVVGQVDGRDAAYAVYGSSEGFDSSGRPDMTLHVVEFAGVDARAEGAMWRFLLSHDLVRRVRAAHRPMDDPLPWLLTDSRRMRRRVGDALYVRVLDLPAALRARGWADSAAATIEVVDDRFEANDGTWRLEVAPEGASLEPTGEPADLRLDIREVGSLYLGGISLARLACAGLVEVRNPDVVGPLDAALRSPEAPWTPEVW